MPDFDILSQTYATGDLYIKSETGEAIPLLKGGFVPYAELTYPEIDSPPYDYLPPLFDTHTYTITMKEVGDCLRRRTTKMILLGICDRRQQKKVLRHMEWWRRYALKTGTEKKSLTECCVEILRPCMRPKMPK